MSRIGKLPVTIPAGVTVKIGPQVAIKGPKGEITRPVVPGTSVSQEGNQLVVSVDDAEAGARHGLMRALLNNMVTGVTKGFERKMEIVGVGYKAEAKGSNVVFNLGFSHPIEFAPPQGVSIKIDKNTQLTISGIDRELVGQVAANIRSFRSPDSYKGKGVRYEGERIRLKAGKAAKKK